MMWLQNSQIHDKSWDDFLLKIIIQYQWSDNAILLSNPIFITVQLLVFETE